MEFKNKWASQSFRLANNENKTDSSNQTQPLDENNLNEDYYDLDEYLDPSNWPEKVLDQETLDAVEEFLKPEPVEEKWGYDDPSEFGAFSNKKNS